MVTVALPPDRRLWWPVAAAIGGVILGFGYTLSPLTVLSLTALAVAIRAAGHGLTPRERRWFFGLIGVAVALRLVAVAALFFFADPNQPFASFFGDEELFKSRTVWLRNVGQGIPISRADFIYTYDTVGRSSYLFVLAYLQALVGEAPYGLHMMNTVFYLAGVMGMYRFVRASYGAGIALAGLAVLLFLPSLSMWSISVLKEPMNIFAIVIEVICAVQIVRAPQWWQRLLAVAGVVACALAMESLRGGGLITAAIGTGGGLLLGLALSSGRRLLVALVTLPLLATLASSSPQVQDGLLEQLRYAAQYHSGHVATPGHSYQLIEPRYYAERVAIDFMPPYEVARFTVKAIASYILEPLPWKMESRAMLAYLPEQMVWYTMIALMPIGILAGLRRDVLLTCVLAAHAAGAIVIVALTSGNVGTLIRHRGLALPYIVWLAAAGGYECVRRYAVWSAAGAEGTGFDGHR